MTWVAIALAGFGTGVLINRLRGRWWLLRFASWQLFARITEPLYAARELRPPDGSLLDNSIEAGLVVHEAPGAERRRCHGEQPR